MNPLTHPNTRKKPFKVVAISKNTGSFGHHGIILLAMDGEHWEVRRIQNGGGQDPWKLGQYVDVPYRKDAPLWHEVGVEMPRCLPQVPADVVAKIFCKKDLTG